MDVQPKIASSSESEQTHSGEDREKQDLHNGDTQKANISRKKRNHLGDAPGISVESSKKRKVPLNDKQSAHGNHKDKAVLSADANVHSDQSSSEIDQSSDSSGDENDESLATTNENDRHRKLTTSTQDVLDGTNDPDPKLKFSNIMIDISYGTVFFVTSTGNYYPKRPLCDYMSILRESEADVRGCEAHIVFRAPFLGGYRAELIFCAQSVLGSEEKFEQFSEDVHSISRLWENGRISVELYNYSDIARAYICMRDFCEALFGQDRCILKCKVLEINWFGEWWPFFVITNVVNHCNELMFKIKQHMKQKLHNTFLDILYKAELPRHIEISVELDYNYYKYDMLNGLRERFKDSNAQYFKFKLVSSGFRNELLQNDHGTLEIKLVDSHHEDDGRRRETVIIEQKPHSSVPDKQSA